MYTTTTQKAVSGSGNRPLLILAFVLFPLSADAGETVSTEEGAQLPVDSREFVLDRATTDDHPGRLTRGGYCHPGVNVEEHKFVHLDGDRRTGGPLVEVVRHSGDYAYLAHDFIGAMSLTQSGTPISIRGSQEDTVAQVQIVMWKLPDEVTVQPILYRTTPDQKGRAGTVGWYSADESSGEAVTVLLGYGKLEGLPRTVIDQFLAQYPSTVDVSLVERDWIDDDLAKWSQILRSKPEDWQVFAAANIMLTQHQLLWCRQRRAVDEDFRCEDGWETGKLNKAVHALQNGRRDVVSSEEYRAEFSRIAEAIDNWRRVRKEGVPPSSPPAGR